MKNTFKSKFAWGVDNFGLKSRLRLVFFNPLNYHLDTRRHSDIKVAEYLLAVLIFSGLP